MSALSRLTSLSGFNIPENSAATPGLWNASYAVIDQNFSAISGVVNSLVVNASGLSGIINGGLAPYSLNPDGATDNAAALASLDAAVLTSSYGLIPPGTYAVASTVTLAGNYIRTPGAKFKVTSGKTLNTTGFWIQPDDPMITTGVGNLYWGGPRPVRPQWWGVSGDLTLDDAPAWNAMIRGVPDHAVIDNTGVRSLLSSTVTMSDREGVVITSRHFPLQSSAAERYNASFKWSGVTSATSDHAMFYWDRCRHCVIEGTAFWAMGKANVCVSTDSIDGNAHGSANRIIACEFNIGGPNLYFVGFDIGRVSTGNQEYHSAIDCAFNCGVHATDQLWINASAGSSHFTVTPGYQLNSYDSGRRMRYYNNASCSTTTVLSWISNTYGIAQDNFASTITSAQAIIDSVDGGVGVRVGASSDLDNIVIQRGKFNLGQYGVEMINGNVHLDDCSFSDFEIDIACLNGNGAVKETKTRSEQARQHVRGVNSGYDLTDSSFGLNFILPGGGYIQPLSGPPISIENNAFETMPAKGSKIYDLGNFSGAVFWKMNVYPPSISTTQLGYFSTSAPHIGRVSLLEQTVTGSVIWAPGTSSSYSFEGPLSMASRIISTRSLPASGVTVSAANSNISANEMGFTIGGTSGASFYIHSAGTVWIFNSALSAKAT